MKKLSAKILRAHKGISFVGVATCFYGHDGKGKFYLMRRSQNSRDEQGCWAAGGGGLKQGVPVIDNVLREIQEEYGTQPLKIDFLGYYDALRTLDDSTPTHWVSLDFLVLLDPSQVRINEPDMFDEDGWFELDNLPSPLHSQDVFKFKKYAHEFARAARQAT